MLERVWCRGWTAAVVLLGLSLACVEPTAPVNDAGGPEVSKHPPMTSDHGVHVRPPVASPLDYLGSPEARAHDELLAPGWSFGEGAPPTTYPKPCHPLFAEDLVPHYEVEIDPAHWALMEDALADGEHEDEDEVYYPIVFRHGADEVTTAMMRLRGNQSDCGLKMQFAISFNEYRRDGRYQGLRRINLDHGGCEMLGERLALSYMRDLGLPAGCANNATLTVNGEFYGLYVQLEHINKDFLDRNFEDDDGNLYKSGDRLKTNEELNDTSDLDAFESADDYDEVDALMDVDEAVEEWAAEAVLPSADNYWLNDWNYYLYSHPKRGFLFVPYDLDAALPQYESRVEWDFMFPSTLQFPADRVLADPRGRAKYEAALRRAIDAFDAAEFELRLERWWSTIEADVARDPQGRYDHDDMRELVENIRGRESWLRAWAAEHLPPSEPGSPSGAEE